MAIKDFWFAECAPCKWQEQHATEDDAITAAEEHVMHHHKKMRPTERAEKRVGHVQNRTDNALGTEVVETPAAPAAEFAAPTAEPAAPQESKPRRTK